MSNLTEQMDNFGPKKIFLIDGTGAMITTIMLGLVLPAFRSEIGMPIDYLYVLSGIA